MAVAFAAALPWPQASFACTLAASLLCLCSLALGHLCRDDLPRPPQVHWIFKNKDHGKMAAAASLGSILLWDVEGGLPQIDKYLYATDNYVVAGAQLCSLALGILARVASFWEPKKPVYLCYRVDED